ncbi:hypothetical protein J5N97_013893 [Dioscorea zingiberensis]|uniref:Uncharacterized protein n=1 Tax=Dioscorea zingiberensis TaxID=325984 RepID=A0A9D5CT38_9LILI|nr:hypothetical protein J5N97_013893 [Dioscorea zingiberensis]
MNLRLAHMGARYDGANRISLPRRRDQVDGDTNWDNVSHMVGAITTVDDTEMDAGEHDVWLSIITSEHPKWRGATNTTSIEVFRLIVSDPDSILDKLTREVKEVGTDGQEVTKVVLALTLEVKDALVKNIRRRMTPRPRRLSGTLR